MYSLRYALFTAIFGLGIFIAAPSFASAATLWVYTEVNNPYQYDRSYDREPNDFMIRVSGTHASPTSFRGVRAGKRVDLDAGSYSVRVDETRGYQVYYSPGCSGFIVRGQAQYCYITLSSSGSYQYPPSYQNPQYPQYPQPTYTAPAITLQKGYVPGFPSTGFAPLSPLSIALAVLALAGVSLFLYPHVRKAFTIVLR